MQSFHALGLAVAAVLLAAGAAGVLATTVMTSACSTPDSASAYQLTLQFGSVGDCLQFAANYTFIATPGMWVNVYEQCDPTAVYCMDFPDLGKSAGYALQSIPQQATSVAWSGLGGADAPTLGLASCTGNDRLSCGAGCTGCGSGLVVGTCGSVQGDVCRIDFRFSFGG